MRALHDAHRGQPVLSRRGRAAARRPRAIVDAPPGGRLPLPDGVRDAIRRRLLPAATPTTVEALEVAAVEGRDVRARRRSSAWLAIGRAGAARAPRRGARRAAARGGAEGRPARSRFSHGLIRETLYGDLTATRRAPSCTRAVARALEARPGASERLELAHHFVEAAVPAADPPRRSSTPSARGTRRSPRWPTSARPTSSTRALRRARPAGGARRAAPRRALLAARAGADAGRRRRGARPTLTGRDRRSRGGVGDDGAARPAPRSASAASGSRPGSSTTSVVAALEDALARLAARRTARCARGCSCAWPSRSTTPTAAQRREELVQEALGDRARARRPADAGLRPRPRRTSPRAAPTRPSAAWPGPRSSSRWPTRWAIPSSRCARARGRSTSCSSSTTSPAPTWRSRRSTASPPTRAIRAPAPTSRCTARGGAMIAGRARRHRGAHPRGHPAGLEPAGLDGPDPRRRASSSGCAWAQGRLRRARGRRAPVRRPAAGDARLARRARHALPAHRPPRRGPARVRPPRRARLRRPSRATTSGRGHRAAGGALRGPSATARAPRSSKRCSSPSTAATSSRPTGIFAGPVTRYLALTAAARGD